MVKRIITVTSGKGGVGKTTLAINLGLALSRYGRTVLIDQDFETGSVRAFLDLEFRRDLYHFLTKGAALRDCITSLPSKWDRRGEYSKFGVIPAPRHFIEELSTSRVDAMRRFAEEIRQLPADYVLLDMKAGLGADIVDSMPYSNSGILIFTPRLPAATGAAAYLIKAQIFRKLQLALKLPSPLLADLSAHQVEEILELFHRADDVYDEEVPNLDHALRLISERLGDHPAARVLERTVGTFNVHYVLNHFDGLEATYERAVKPFVERLVEIVSSRLRVNNLGWIKLDPEIHQANCERIPALLFEAVSKERSSPANLVLDELETMVTRRLPSISHETGAIRELDLQLEDQLFHLERIFGRLGTVGYRDHFHFIASSVVNQVGTRRAYSLGDTQLLSPQEMQRLIMDYYQQAGEE